MFELQNLSLDKPKKKPGKIWGHSRTLSRVEALGMVRLLNKSFRGNCNLALLLGLCFPSYENYGKSQIFISVHYVHSAGLFQLVVESNMHLFG